jgi:hypothetical protein
MKWCAYVREVSSPNLLSGHHIAKALQLSSLSNLAYHPAFRWAGRVAVQVVYSCRLLELEAMILG